MRARRHPAIDERTAILVAQSGSFVARLAYVVRALRAYLTDPRDTAIVQVLHMALNDHEAALRRFCQAPGGAELLRERPAIDQHTIDIARLSTLPAGTLGRELAELLARGGLTPYSFPAISEMPADQAYVYQRYRQTHDIIHVMLGQDTSAHGELALQGFAFAQSHARSHAAIALTVGLRYLRHDVGLARAAIRGFLCGRRTPSLMGVRWEDHWHEPVAALRDRLGIRL